MDKKLISTLTLLMFFAVGLFSQNYVKNIEDAKTCANESHKKILLVFEGSDWCAPCMKLEREILGTETFKNLAKDEFVILKADFPRSKKNKLSDEQQAQNNVLAEKYNTKGYFPFVAVLNANAELMGSMGYENTSPEAYFKKLNAIN